MNGKAARRRREALRKRQDDYVAAGGGVRESNDHMGRYKIEAVIDAREPDTAIVALAKLREIVDRITPGCVAAMIGNGATWEDVARSFGVSRQAAHSRWSRAVDELLGE